MDKDINQALKEKGEFSQVVSLVLFQCYFFSDSAHKQIWGPFHFDLNADDEKDLVEVIKKFTKRGFPFTKNKVMSLAYQYAEMNGRKGFSKITKQAGRWWLKDFLKWFPEVHLKKGHNRAMCANKPTIDKFFNLYQDLLQKFNIESPRHIWNTDESGVQDVPKEEQVIGVTGEKAHTMSPKEQGKTTTVLMFANACGQVFPPLVIFKGARVSDA